MTGRWGWYPPALADLHRLIQTVEQGLHSECRMGVSFNNAGDLLMHLDHKCGLLPEIMPMTGGDNHDR